MKRHAASLFLELAPIVRDCPAVNPGDGFPAGPRQGGELVVADLEEGAEPLAEELEEGVGHPVPGLLKGEEVKLQVGLPEAPGEEGGQVVGHQGEAPDQGQVVLAEEGEELGVAREFG